MYEMATGQKAFRGRNQVKTLDMIINEYPVRPRSIQHSMPKDIEAIILKAMEKEKENRYVSAAALHNDLVAFREGRPVSANPPGPFKPFFRWLKKNKKSILSLSIVLIVAVSVLFIHLPGTDECDRRTGDREEQEYRLMGKTFWR